MTQHEACGGFGILQTFNCEAHHTVTPSDITAGLLRGLGKTETTFKD